jgi:MFS family permease
MSLVVPLLVTVVACNFTLLAAIAAGRSSQRWGRRLWLWVELAFFAMAAIGIVGVASAVADALGWELARRDIRLGLTGALALAIAALLGGVLTYLEYSVLGRRKAFREDLRASLWVGRSGVKRWG